MQKLFIFLVSILIAQLGFAESLNDFSILIPLPAESDFAKLIAPGLIGQQGLLIPLSAMDPLPQLIFQSDNRSIYKNNLRLVAVRIDPCFNEQVVQACRRQLRLVWQPIVAISGKTSTLDAAVHTFYEFEAETWKIVLQDWKALASGQVSDPLQIHPVIRSQTLNGKYYNQLQNIILKHCGEKNLVRITAMAVRGQEQVWIFEGFDIINQGALRLAKPITIPRVDSVSQLAVFNISVENEYFGGLNPVPDQDINFFKLLSDSKKAKSVLSESDMKAVIGTAFDYENPKIHNTATLDCVSCHLAQGARRWAEQNFSTWNWDQEFKDQYASPWFRPATGQNIFQSNQFRAFGYFTNQPVVSQRVINETIEVSAALGLTLDR